MNITRAEVFKNIAWLGGTVTLAAALRYAFFETSDRLTLGLSIAGPILFVIGLVANYRALLVFLSKRGTRLGANTALLTVSVLAILVVANVLAARHPKRFDLTEEKLHSLSDQSKKIVAGLSVDVTVMKFDRSDDRVIKDLIAEYRAVSRHIRYELIDPQENRELATKYSVQRFGEIVLSSGGRSERANDATEQQITNALLKLTREASKTVCFLDGHGERSESSDDETKGFSGVLENIKRENYQSKTITLVSSVEIPMECTELIVPGPQKTLFPNEIEATRKYLANGGKVMLLIDPDTSPGFEGLLKEWGVSIGNNFVWDPGQFVIQAGPSAPAIKEYSGHDVTRSLNTRLTLFPMTRSVSVAKEKPSQIEASELFKSSPESWAESDLKGRRPTFDEGKDQKGPVSLAVAASRKIGEKEARLLVFGGASFASNGFLAAGSNRDLFQNAVNWLAQDDDLISVRPRNPANRQVTLTQSQQNMLLWGSTILLPGAVVLAGIVIWWRRR